VVKVNPLYYKDIADRNYIYSVPFSLFDVENGNIPIVDTLVNHAVAGYINGF
jgi:hypothetical protein